MKARNPGAEELSAELLERTAAMLRVLAHPHRLKIVEILQGEGEAPVHRIMERLGLPQAALSQHLNHMRRSGLLSARRRGREVWYAISDPSSLTILECIRRKVALAGM